MDTIVDNNRFVGKLLLIGRIAHRRLRHLHPHAPASSRRFGERHVHVQRPIPVEDPVPPLNCGSQEAEEDAGRGQHGSMAPPLRAPRLLPGHLPTSPLSSALPRPLPSSSSIFTTLLPVATSSRPQCTVLKGHRSGSAFSRAEELLVMALRPLRSTSAAAAVSPATIPRRASSSWTPGPRLD